MKTKILILGGNGFIGSTFVDFFASNPECEVYATKHLNSNYCKNVKATYLQVDLRLKDDVQRLFDQARPDVVIHAAAVTTGSKDDIERPYLHVTDNTIINALVFEACHIFKVKHCIFFSCTVMYQSKDTSQSESDWKISDKLIDSYFGVANMKIYAERLCEFYSRLGETKYTAIRHSNVYGPRDKFDLDKCHVLPAMIRKVIEANGSLEVWGDGTAKRDLIYIDDLINFVSLVIKNQTDAFELFNCGYGQAFSILDIINIIKNIVKKPELQLVFNNSKPNIPTTLILNCSKANETLNWYPITTLQIGIDKTVKYYKEVLCSQ
ncbi:MAG: NAD-dependent epimerase/dehydratase family protein [Candidatus Magasanikbacteria bacterium]|nr:NAD-dependent epimerase/dehydratase family protein [Candidatus Magasanikbacteria bacterium]